MRSWLATIASSLLLASGVPAWAAPPGFSVQGRLTDSNGINRDGTFALKFTIFDAATAGTALWSKTFPSLSVRNGNFQAILGDPGNVPGQTLPGVFSGDSRFLEIQVLSGPGVSGPEAPLVPRQQLVSVPYSLRAEALSSIGAITASVSGAERMRIDAAGNVGIGTTGPGATLDVRRAPGVNIYRASDESGQYRWRIDQNFDMFLTNAGSADLIKIGQGTSWFNSGNVGIGTTAPTSALTVLNGDIRLSTTAGSRGIIFQDGSIQTTAAGGAATDEIILRGSFSNGSIGSRVKVYNTVVINNGSAMTYTNDPLNGDKITINTRGVYAISLLSNASGFDFLGISLNAASTVSLTLLAPANRLAVGTTQGGSQPVSMSWTGTLNANDVIRSHQDGATSGNPNFHQLSIARIQ